MNLLLRAKRLAEFLWPWREIPEGAVRLRMTPKGYLVEE